MARKLVSGVGVNSPGEFTATVGGEISRVYAQWRDMLARCYGVNKQKKYPYYVGCTVSDYFKDFQAFASWHNAQAGSTSVSSQLDKDLLVKGNKVYSENTCTLLPACINLLLNCRRTKRGPCPLGVTFLRTRNKYNASCHLGEGQKNLGNFDTPEEAFAAYKTAKEAFIRQRAEEYRDQIDPRAYAALMAYEIKIDD